MAQDKSYTWVQCHISAEFQVPAVGDYWFTADVMDLSVIGVQIRFPLLQGGHTLCSSDIEWQDARFKFEGAQGKDILDGHFLMIYKREGGFVTTGVEFTDVTPEQQFKLVTLYAQYRQKNNV